MALFQPILDDERAVMARVRNVAFIGWRDAPTAMHMREWHRLGRTLTKEHGNASACIDIVVRGTPRFTDDVRQAAEDLARDSKIFGLGVAHAIIIPGLAGTAVRAFVQTILLIGRPANPVRVFHDLASATGWLAPRLASHGWSERELSNVSNELVDVLGVAPRGGT